MGNKPVKIATQYERLMARVAARSGWTPRKRHSPESEGGEVERAGVEKATVVKEATETEGVKEQPVFDAASWKPTEQALAMLARLEQREKGHGSQPVVPQMTIAEQNEARYGRSKSHFDRVMEKMSNASGKRYGEIEALAGKNGDCHSRETTYRRWKFGAGNLSRKGWLKRGFEENTR